MQSLEDDVKNLESQIRNLLKSMDNVKDITEAKVLQLSNEEETGNDSSGPVGLQRMELDDPSSLSDLDILEICLNEKIMKYSPVDGSVFFVPILEKCIFGMSLCNVSSTTLKRPRISLHLVSDPSTSDRSPKSFQYHTQVNLKEARAESFDKSIDNSFVYPDTFLSHAETDTDIPPGCQVLVTATFSYPDEIISRNSFTLAVSIHHDSTELWTREIPISDDHFKPPFVESILAKHYLDVSVALGTEIEMFKAERLLSYNEHSPAGSLKRFMETLGYENIASSNIGIDATIDSYAVKMPSMLWGTCLKIEKCSRKESSVRVMILTRSKDQMRYIFRQLKSWLQNERRRERKNGMAEMTVTPIAMRAKDSLCGVLQSELDLISKLEKVHAKINRNEIPRTSILTSVDKDSVFKNVDTHWLFAYCNLVDKTDTSFVTKM